MYETIDEPTMNMFIKLLRNLYIINPTYKKMYVGRQFLLVQIGTFQCQTQPTRYKLNLMQRKKPIWGAHTKTCHGGVASESWGLWFTCCSHSAFIGLLRRWQFLFLLMLPLQLYVLGSQLVPKLFISMGFNKRYDMIITSSFWSIILCLLMGWW